MDFPHCYRILGLAPESDWEQARHRYQQLASRYHPDRPAALTDGQSLSEINLAWRQLRKYYQQHGHMPLEAKGVCPASRPVTPFQPSLPPIKARYWSRIMTIVAAATVLLILIPHRTPPTAQPQPQPEGDAAAETPMAAASGETQAPIMIRHGDPLGYVVETLGPPHDTRGSRWYYGDSWIELRDGRVSDWNSSADYPLPTDTLSHLRQR